MENKKAYLKLNLKATEAHRISWNNQYFNIESFLLLDNQIESREQAKLNLEKCALIVKMIPFKNEFKAKLFSHILGEEKNEPSSIFAFTAILNLFEKKVLDIIDMRETQGSVGYLGNSPLNAEQSNILKLTNSEKESLINQLQKLVEGNMLVHLREPFVCFFPEFLNDDWKERIPKGKSKTSLIPFQGVFPFSGAIERVYKENLYVLDDLYCPILECDCNEVNCLVLSIDEETGKEILHGGFKYQFEKKTFKNMAEYPFQFNAQEWFKQFSLNQPVQLTSLFEARYHFIRKLINQT